MVPNRLHGVILQNYSVIFTVTTMMNSNITTNRRTESV